MSRRYPLGGCLSGHLAAAAALLVLGTQARASIGTFDISVVDPASTEHKGYALDIDVDATGNPHVVYTRYTNSSSFDIVHAVDNGGGWSLATADAGVSFTTTLAVGADGASDPHVYYMKDTTAGSNRLHHATGPGGIWQTTIVDDLDRIHSVDGIAEVDGDLHVVTGYASAERGRYFTKSSGGSWSSGQDFDAAEPLVRDPRIAVDDTGVVHVVYTCVNCAGGAEGVKYARLESGAWTVETVADTLQTGNFVTTDVAVGPDGTPLVAFVLGPQAPSYPLHKGLWVATREAPGDWSLDPADSTSFTAVSNTTRISLEVDQDGNPHVARLVRTQVSPFDAAIQYLVRNGGVWESAIVDSTVFETRPVALDLDASGNPFIAYVSGPGPLNQYEMRVASIGNVGMGVGAVPAVSSNALGFGANRPDPFARTTTIEFQVPAEGVVSLAVFDVAGRRVATLLDRARTRSGTHHVAWDGTDHTGRGVASGIYFYRLEVSGDVATKRVTVRR